MTNSKLKEISEATLMPVGLVLFFAGAILSAGLWVGRVESSLATTSKIEDRHAASQERIFERISALNEFVNAQVAGIRSDLNDLKHSVERDQKWQRKN